MKIGITYDLKEDYQALGIEGEYAAEFDKTETIEAIDGALSALGYQTERIGHAKNLIKQLVAGKRWDMVFNICEGLHGTGREAQVPAILDLYEIPYVFSDPLVLALTLDKAMTKRVIRDLKLPTPDFFEVEKEEDIARVNLEFPLFAKPVAEGTGKGIDRYSIIRNREELRFACLDKLKRFRQPVLVETYLPGREFTVGIVGTGSKARCIGLMECIFKPDADTEAYTYDNKSQYEIYMEYRFPEGAETEKIFDLALKAWQGLRCRDGGRIDIRMDANGEPHFIEVNPLAGLHPVDSDLVIIAGKNGIPYQELISLIMQSAMERLNY